MTDKELQVIFEETAKDLEKSLTTQYLAEDIRCALESEENKGYEIYAALFASIQTSLKLNRQFLYRILQKIVVKEK